MKKRKILKVLDVFGWAYYWIVIEQMRYTKHNISYMNWETFIKNIDNLEMYDLIYFPSPTMCRDEVNKNILKIKSNPKYNHIKIIGAYSGLINKKYFYADLIISISLSDLNKLKNESLFPVIFLPESVDTKTFTYQNNPIIVDKWSIPHLELGWIGKHAPDKRSYLLDDLLLPIKKQCKHGKQFFIDNKNQQEIIDFYHSVECLVLTSSHECLPRSVLEAMATGLPVISTNVGSVPWLLQKEMIVDVQPDEQVIRQINKKLKLLLDNPLLKEQVGIQNRKHIEENFSWEKNQILWDEVFDLLCEGKFEKIYQISNIYISKLNQNVSKLLPINSTNNKLQINVLKVIDCYGWAYDWIYQDQIKYTKNKLSRNLLSELHRKPYAEHFDIVYFSGANLGETRTLTKKFKLQNIKIIGAYSGENFDTYQSNDIDVIVSISYPFTEELKSMYPNKTVIFIPEGVNTEFFNYNEPNLNRFEVGWAGRKSEVKRFHLLDKFKYPVKTRSAHSDQDLQENKTLEPMRNFYKEIDVLILPSKSECMPRVVLEAMASGKPVITTNVGSIPLLLDKEWIVPNTTDEEIVQNINTKLDILKNSPELRKEVGLRNRQQVETFFDWQKIMPLWDKLFLSLYQNDYDSVNIVSDEWLNNITSKQLINIKKFDNILKKETSVALDLEKTFSILVNSKYKFWLVGQSCFEAIKYCQLKSYPIQIGVENVQIKQNIENLNLSDIKVEISSIKNLKKHSTFNCEINVPYPVVGYLETFYHKKFRELMK